MGIRVIDTLESMGDFAVAQAKDIVFEDKENLQDKLNNNELSGQRDFVKSPIELDKEITGVLPVSNIDPAIARLADVLDKTSYEGSENGVVKSADTLKDLSHTITELNTAIENSHEHLNKNDLDKIISNGLGNKLLADNGIYKELLVLSNTEPTDTYCIWIDTTETSTPILKIHNGTDWVAVSGGSSGGKDIVTYVAGNNIEFITNIDGTVSINSVSTGSGGLAPKSVTNASIVNGNKKVIISWEDPDDLIIQDVALMTWAGTKLVMNENRYPNSPTDGTIMLDNKINDNYKTNGYVVENLENNKTYYFALFPYSTDEVYNCKEENRLLGNPALIKLDSCTNIQTSAAMGSVTVLWNDPDESKTVGGETVTWSKTVLVYKEGKNAPLSVSDGTVAVEETTRNQYSSTGYEITGLTDGKEYSFSLFAINNEDTPSDVLSKTVELYSTLVITTDEVTLYGKDITITNNTDTITTAFNADGSVDSVNIPWIGETIITSTDGTDIATSKINIATYENVYSAELSFLKIVTFADGTDEEISAMIQAHYDNKINITDYWAVGDKRNVNLSAMSATGVGESHRAQTVQMAIADFEHDNLTTPINGHTMAAITLTQVDCLMDSSNASSPTNGSGNTENGYMNNSNTNSGGWTSCARRTWCNSVYYNALPSTLKSAVKEVKKLTSAGSQSSTINTTNDKVFLLSEIEIFGSTSYSKSGEGSQYEYYKTTANRYKLPKWNSDRVSHIYWDRSPYGSDSSGFCIVSYDDGANWSIASNSIGFAPCLCI